MTEKSLPPGLHPDTLAVREAVERSQWGEHSEALYLSSSFVQSDCASSARRFANEEAGYTYSRTANPTVTSFERRLAAMEGTECAVATSTGMSAILLVATAACGGGSTPAPAGGDVLPGHGLHTGCREQGAVMLPRLKRAASGLGQNLHQAQLPVGVTRHQRPPFSIVTGAGVAGAELGAASRSSPQTTVTLPVTS